MVTPRTARRGLPRAPVPALLPLASNRTADRDPT